MHPMIFFVFIGLLILSLPVTIPYVIWMIYTASKRRWLKFVLQIAIPVAAFVSICIISLILLLCTQNLDRIDTFDARFRDVKEIFRYETELDFHFDGYSFVVQKLPESVRKRFENADEKLLTEFPKNRPSSTWKAKPWAKSPLDNKLQTDLDRLLNIPLSPYYEKTSELKAHFQKIREALSKGNAFYTFYYHDSDKNDLAFYMIDLENDRLYCIDSTS